MRVNAPLLLALVGLAACTIGPGTIARDRIDYSAAMAESWKRQMLLNVVKLRYSDAPVFLDVGQVVSGYTMQSTFSALGTIFSTNGPVPGVPNSSIGLSAQGQYTDRPTVTYTPLMGERFARSLMTPIPPPSIMSLIQAGNPVDLVLRLAVHVVNGLRNRYGGDARATRGDPDFYELVERLRRIQLSGAVGIRVHRTGKEEATVMSFRRTSEPIVEEDIAAVRRLLGLDPLATEFRVVHGAVAANDKEIAIVSRSILEILIDLSSFITVPEADVREQRVSATTAPDEGPSGPLRPLMRVASSPDRPGDAFVAVPYRNSWFWIDDRDIPSKRLFTFLMFVFTLVETGTKEQPPIITIPAG